MRDGRRAHPAHPGGFTRENAQQILADGNGGLVAFGRMFIANPDLPERPRTGAPLNRYDRTPFYGGDARGYTDYPFPRGMAAAQVPLAGNASAARRRPHRRFCGIVSAPGARRLRAPPLSCRRNTR
ncbi:N-ethylmaleimide reductase [Burkholderia pseudomultivorans]|uniref:N-ethylmaleimide reductase n=1 Tax=Burkholderia pseudomultivorans TaxID=1207504 RepID=A0ABU2E2G4_9BURK|nr:N-ethylmaleimide reductase [Burkholderia pseudomultivorans]MDR8736577.1 N-ethylmaleimide reductase [Burkholderia pseudomultivorans]MDR8740499.1 N-ethylmaleimide reductase [Burkholderia pseudomultivorans]MDR8754052.1 N-ethylmaleimide reductase [Burkholderia pseudomultivorans]MDR8776913.1 N-ethylmaleimide reductase [Burkholderia pseudomultivorans]